MNWPDKIGQFYIITLEKRKERRANMLHTVDYLGIPYRFWRGVPRLNGAEGLRETMMHLFHYALANDMDYLGVLEDDCEFLYHPHELINTCLEQLPTDFDLFYLGGNLLSPPVRYSENLLKVQAVYATHSVIYSKKAIEKILPLLGNSNDPFDILLFKEIQKQGNSYFCYPMLTTQRTGESDIFDPKSVEKNPILRQYYDEKTRSIDWGKFMKEQYDRNTAHL